MRVTLDDCSLDVTDSGRGIPLLLLHGFPLSAAIFESVRPVVEGVARVVAPDLRGFGASDAPPAGYSMGELADEVVRLANHLGLDRFVLGGHSMGGYVALQVAAQHRQRLLALVLMDTRAGADSPEAAAGRRDTAASIRDGGRGPFLEGFVSQLVGPTTTARFPDQVGRLRAIAEAVPDHVLAGCLEGMAARADSRPLLPQLDLPALVMVGAEDQLTPVSAARELVEALPDARLKVIPESGHTPSVERPLLVGDAINVFLRELG